MNMFIFIVRVFVFRSELNSPDSNSGELITQSFIFDGSRRWGRRGAFGGGGVSADVT